MPKASATLNWFESKLLHFILCYVRGCLKVSSSLFLFAFFLFILLPFGIDYWSGVCRSWVPSKNAGFWAERANVHREVSSWALSSCFLCIGCGLLWPYSWQPVSHSVVGKIKMQRRLQTNLEFSQDPNCLPHLSIACDFRSYTQIILLAISVVSSVERQHFPTIEFLW